MPAVGNYALLFLMTKTLVSYSWVCLIPLVFSLLRMDASTTKAIAQKIKLSDRTVRNYWIRLQDILGVYIEPNNSSIND